MDLIELKKNWDEFGRQDPLFAILSNPEKKGNKWGTEEFFTTGEYEIDAIFNYLNSLDHQFHTGRALDFGCGVGRLTQALCSHFEECCGVDIAKSMIDLAIKYNRYGNKCKYFANETNDLKLFQDNSFDFIYTRLVLQHIRADYSKKYIEEFLRILKPGGILIFDMPSGPTEFTPLPNSAYKVEITPLNKPASLEAGTKSTISVKVKNISDSTWLGFVESGYKIYINLGNHWLDKTGKLLINDDGRINLPKSIKPHEEVELALIITVPRVSGDYILELDLVLEGVTWFAQKNSKSAVKMPVKVLGTPKDQIESIMEIHNIPKDDVMKIIIASDGNIIDIQPDFSLPGWTDFRYCVTKKIA